jgi:exopolyphosphatase / guanosine-5'-triphosphate,3'-diphosphate pyrophosphatase
MEFLPASASPAAPAATPWPGHLAAIDIGSNSFRLEIGQLSPGRYKRIDYLKETVRLGAGLDTDSTLTEDAMQRGLTCLARFAQRLQGYAPHQVRAVATQTLREAHNRDVFLERAQAVLGHAIEVISGREEARLIYAGVARLQPSELPRLVIDIGGRSTEMILGQGRTPLRAESFQIGSVSLSMRYFADGRFTEQAFRAAQVAAGAELEEALVPFAPRHWREALGSSGTAGAVSQLLVANGVSDGTITPEGLRWCINQCLKVGRMDKLDLPGLRDDRRAVIAGGLAILYTLSTHFGIEALQPARGALRQGVIFDLDERLHASGSHTGHDMRDASVAELQRRFEVDLLHAGRVSTVADALYTQVAAESAPLLRRELRWASALHEIGMMVSHHDHHRHSAYLLGHVDAAGFSQSQQRRLAALVLAQRGGLRKVEDELSDATLALQVLCLRLAIIKCHARGAVDPGEVTVHTHTADGAHKVSVTLPPGWVEANPRTYFLLQEEVQAWARVKVLGLRLVA